MTYIHLSSTRSSQIVRGNNTTKLSRDFFAAVKSSLRHAIKNWKVKHINGAIKYHSSSGLIEVKRKGYYYIYSQMFYYDGSTIQMGHNTYINHEKVMESLGSVISAQRKYNTKYHGGVFLLQENDTISVRIPYTMHFHMDSEGSFFGVFLLKNTAIQGEQMYFKHMYKYFVLLHLCSNSRTYKLILATYNS